MPVGALLAPILAEAILPEAVLGTTLGTAATAGLGGALGAGSGALFGELTGGDPGKGALSGAIGGAAGPIGGALGEAAGIGSTAGGILGGAAGGAAGAGVTGGNPLIGAAEGAAAPAINAVSGLGTPSANITPSSPATGAGSAAGSGGSAGAGSAAASAPIPLDPTAGGGAGPPAAFLGTITEGGPNVDGSGAMGLNSPNTFLLPGTDQPISNSYMASPSGGGGDIGSSIMGLIQNNPGALLSGGLLASQLFRGNEQYPAEKSLQTLATNTGTQGAALSGYINSGTLPPGAKQAVDQATNAAKATLRSRFAETGLSGSTMEAQALGEVDSRAAGQTFQMADQLLAQGADFTKISGTLYDELLKTQAGTDQEFQKALMTFAGGLGGLRGGGSTA
jgi:hypothetical protein